MSQCETPVALQVLCLPELLLLVAEFLDQFDITVCVRVSSSWHSILRPLIWRIVLIDLPPTPSLFPLASSPPPQTYCPDSPVPLPHQEPPSLMARLGSFPVSLLYDNASHIRSFTEKVLLLQELSTLKGATSLPPFQNLVHLDTMTLSEPVLDLLKTEAVQRTLESLTCHSIFNRTGTDPKEQHIRHHCLSTAFWRVLEFLPKLRVLKLQYAVLKEAEVWNFLRVLQRLECLELSNTYHSSFLLFADEKYSFAHIMQTLGRPEEEEEEEEDRGTVTTVAASPLSGTNGKFEQDATGLLMFPHLRSLTMQSNMADSGMQLEWLRHFPNLQHFHWDEMWFMNFSALARMLYSPFTLLPGSLDRAFRTTLQSLDLSDTGLGDMTLMGMIGGLPGLSRLNVSGTQFGEHSAKALLQRERSRRGQGSPPPPLPVHDHEETTAAAGIATSATTTTAWAALESLNLQGCSEVSSKTIQAMLETFSELKEFKAVNLRVRDMVDDDPLIPPDWSNVITGSSSLSFSENPAPGQSHATACYFIPRPWVCLGIETLDIKFCDLAVLNVKMSPSTSTAADASHESVVQHLGIVQAGSLMDNFTNSSVNSDGRDNYNSHSIPYLPMVDQARDIIYSQLSKLTQLVRLGLGENRLTRTIDLTRPLAHNIRRMVKHAPVLDLSLDHGLQTLGSLVRLEELDLQAASPRMQISDAQWMVRAWPRLRRLEGQFSPTGTHVEIASYLKDHHPRVRIPSHADL